MEVESVITGKRGVSLPFTDSCGPFISKTSDEDAVFSAAEEYGKKAGWKYLEMRGWPEATDRTLSTDYFGHTLDLAGTEEEIFLNFRDSTKRNVRKAVREGVTTEISTSRKSLEEFCSLNFKTRKKHGLPPQPDLFFRKIFEHVIDKGLGMTTLAFYKNNLVAGAVFFHFGNKAIYKYGASDENYQFLRANNLVMWETIKWYSRNGYHSLSFGRTEPGNIGLRQFKSGWGAQEEVIKYYRYDLRASAFVRKGQNITGFHNRLFSRMPDPLLSFAGKLLYRHMG